MAEGAALNVGGRKLGPFPPVVWAGIVGGGVALGLLVKNRQRSAVTDASTMSVDPSVVDPYSVGGYVGLKNLAGGATTSTSSTTTTTTAPTTNVAWLRVATDRLVAEGQDPGLVQAALTKFLAGDTLSVQEASIVNMAMRYYGAPPDGAPAMTVNRGATTTTTTTPAAPVPDYRSMSTAQLLDLGDAAVRAGSGYEPFANELVRRVTVDKSLSVNDPILSQPSGQPRPIWPVMLPMILQFLQNAGVHW